MDVELQILKHLARDPHPTVGIIEDFLDSLDEAMFHERYMKDVFPYTPIPLHPYTPFKSEDR